MNPTVITQALLLALALVMFGLGLSLTVDDFVRLRRHPKAVVLALGLQALVLPAVCWGIVVLLDIPPLLAVGMMLLAASPGGVTANLYSHLFGGNVALNISLTAINTVLSIVTLPLITNAAIAAFARTGQVVPLQFAKVAEVMAIVLVPVAVGMFVRHRAPRFAHRMDRPMRIFSALVLALLIVGAVAKEWRVLAESFASVGFAVLAFNLVSLLAGFYGARAAGLDRPTATAICYEIGIHNGTLALYVAVSVLGDLRIGLPAAVYSVLMYLTATAFGWLVLRGRAREPASVPS